MKTETIRQKCRIQISKIWLLLQLQVAPNILYPLINIRRLAQPLSSGVKLLRRLSNRRRVSEFVPNVSAPHEVTIFVSIRKRLECFMSALPTCMPVLQTYNTEARCKHYSKWLQNLLPEYVTKILTLDHVRKAQLILCIKFIVLDTSVRHIRKQKIRNGVAVKCDQMYGKCLQRMSQPALPK